jgi:hypothetical protein
MNMKSSHRCLRFRVARMCEVSGDACLIGRWTDTLQSGPLASVVDTRGRVARVRASFDRHRRTFVYARKGGPTEKRHARPHQQEKGRSHEPREHLPQPGVVSTHPRSADRSVRDFEAPGGYWNAFPATAYRGTSSKTRFHGPSGHSTSPPRPRPPSLIPDHLMAVRAIEFVTAIGSHHAFREARFLPPDAPDLTPPTARCSRAPSPIIGGGELGGVEVVPSDEQVGMVGLSSVVVPRSMGEEAPRGEF